MVKRLFVMVCRLVVLLALFTTVRGLELLNLKVPRHADLNEAATLTCDFALHGAKLYSVKWYKDEFEFFRFMPDNSPQSEAFIVPGVTLDLSRSNKHSVTLTKLTFNATGTYRCEVSTEAPNFETVFDNRNMTVMALPQDDPMIEGILSTYTIGDYVTGNCTSAKSNPASVLSWHINGMKVERWFLEHYPAAEDHDSQGLQTRTLGIRFQTEKQHFSGQRGTMELRCTAVVGDLSWHRDVKPVLAKLTNQKLAQELPRNSASFVLASVNIGVVMMLTLMAS